MSNIQNETFDWYSPSIQEGQYEIQTRNQQFIGLLTLYK
jgi:hypothetical protein